LEEIMSTDTAPSTHTPARRGGRRKQAITGVRRLEALARKARTQYSALGLTISAWEAQATALSDQLAMDQPASGGTATRGSRTRRSDGNGGQPR
jgi:transcription elongation factor